MDLTAAARERQSQAKDARKQVPRSGHGQWQPATDRADPVSILTAQDEGRLQWLVPVRHARMAESSFAFYRGAAAIMAADLARTPTIGVNAQLCGDAHLANFGTFASAERVQVFDVNDFDETLPGPWEWDVKRMAASFVLAGRENGFTDDQGRTAAVASVAAYRQAMATFAETPAMQVWYAQVSLDQLREDAGSKKRFDKFASKARGRNSEKALSKLTETVDGELRIRSQAPLLIPLRELAEHVDPDEIRTQVTKNFRAYPTTLAANRRHVLEKFSVVDVALKVVGVGSVGTRCFIVLLTGRDHGEPLFLQFKEATDAVLEAQLPRSQYEHHGERVVRGQRLMQASSDIMLGWSGDAGGKQFYWRQFHDMKGSADVATMDPDNLVRYASVCGWTLAHAHARSGDAVSIAGYLGSGNSFDRALGDFAVAYADQNDRDYASFTDAITAGRIQAHEA